MQNKILVLGGNGMAGHIISLYLSEQKFDVDILCRKNVILSNRITTIIWDEKFSTLEKIISSKYDVIINCIGMLKEACDHDPKAAIKINSYLPQFLASRIKKNTKLIHLSTDCVFSGSNGPYNETSIPDGTTIYDISKATGELINGQNIIVLRNSIIGPDMNASGIGLFNWFMRQTGDIKGYENWIWSGITTLELAKQIYLIIGSDLHGLFHLTNNKNISKYNLLQIFNEIFNRNLCIEKSNLKEKVDKTLISTIGKFKIPSYEKMLVEMQKWIANHKELYRYE